ncbi:MAG: hypothetical protein ACE14S_06310 [Candidatus Bathyarchaeia archaeon]
MEAKCIVSFRNRLISFALGHPRFFEPFAPFGIRRYLNGKLKQYQKQGLISTYKTRTKRFGRWHYRVEVEVDLTSTQGALVLSQLLHRNAGKGR